MSETKNPSEGLQTQWIAVVRIRGRVNVRRQVEDTLKLLRLHKPNHCVVIRYTPSVRGMLIKAQNKIAWGEINFDTFLALLKERGRTIGNKRLTDELVQEFTNGQFKTIEELARAIWNGSVRMRDLKWLKPVFRLHPPKGGGYKRSVKKMFQNGGSLGYWGQKINELLMRMI